MVIATAEVFVQKMFTALFSSGGGAKLLSPFLPSGKPDGVQRDNRLCSCRNIRLRLQRLISCSKEDESPPDTTNVPEGTFCHLRFFGKVRSVPQGTFLAILG